MKASDPNDPMSFYTNLQKNFASAGLGQQALMASVEAKKFEDMGLKTEAAKTELYKKNPALLDTQIAKARDAGDDKLANQLAEQRGQIQIQIDTDRAMDFAKLNLVNAQTATQRAQAGKLSQEIESGKFDWKVINDVTGTPTHMAKINKKTGETTYEPIALPGGAAVPGAKPTAPKAGERPPLTSFGGTPGQPTNAAPAPVATPTTPSAPMAAAPTTVSLYDQATQTYKLTQDPEYIQIVDYARQNAAQIGQDPVLRDRIGQAMKDLQAKRQAELGSFVKFQ
jgi:hypothetical protein